MNQDQVKQDTARARDAAMANARRMRQENQMTGRIRKAWAQLDVATDECIRLGTLIQQMKTAGDHASIPGFEQDLKLEQAKARGKAEILAILMPAPLDTPEAISREAGHRWNARRQGVAYETPGIRMVAATVMDDLEPNQVWT